MTTGVPTIAVVMPALNSAARLPQALASLAAEQATFTGGTEVVLVDGGSKDATAAIASAHPGLRVITAPGTSIYEALNRGIAETRAPAIIFLNTDDVLLPGALAAWSEALACAPEAGIARGWPIFVDTDPKGEIRPLSRDDRRAATPLTFDLLLRGACGLNSLCVRRETFGRIGEFDTRYRLAADRDWMLRAVMAGVSFTEIQRPVYRYTSHPGSSTLDRSRRNYALMRREHLDIAARHLASPHLEAEGNALRRWHAAETGMLAWHHARNRDFQELAATLATASRKTPGWPFTLAGEVVRHLRRRKFEASG